MVAHIFPRLVPAPFHPFIVAVHLLMNRKGIS
jgi:hypothetical protein